MVIEPMFVNRTVELKSLKELAYRGASSVLYIYGPEGCGKTRLLKEFVKKFDGVGIYIDALEEESVSEAIVLSPTLKPVREFIVTLTYQITGPVGKWLSMKIFTLIDKIVVRAKVRDEHLTIIVDDVIRALGVDNVERYMKWLYEAIHKINESYKPRSVLIIASTSEGYSLTRVMRHSYNVINLIWNLNREAYKDLVKQLKPPNKEAEDRVWELTGGNPRRVIEIATIFRWDIDRWRNQLKLLMRDIANLIRAKNLTKETLQLIEDPDILNKNPTLKIRESYTLLIEHNLMMYSGAIQLTSWTEKDRDKWKLKPDRNLGIGEYYAWQIPAYRWILHELLQEN